MAVQGKRRQCQYVYFTPDTSTPACMCTYIVQYTQYNERERVYYVSQCLDGIVIIISMSLPFDAIIFLPPRTKNTLSHTHKYNVRLLEKHTYRKTSRRTNECAETEMPVSTVLCKYAIVCSFMFTRTHNVCCVLCQTEAEQIQICIIYWRFADLLN